MDPAKRIQEQSQILAYEDTLLKIRSDSNGYECTGESLTKQADAFDADINNIVRRFTPEIAYSALALRPGEYLDLTEAAQYHESLETIRQAQEDFNQLPANIRSSFDNDPGQLINAMYDETQLDKLVSLGIIQRTEPEPAPQNPTPT